MLQDMWWPTGNVNYCDISEELQLDFQRLRELPLIPFSMHEDAQQYTTVEQLSMTVLAKLLAQPYLSSDLLEAIDIESVEGAKRLLARVIHPASRSRLEAEVLQIARNTALWDEQNVTFEVERHLPGAA